MSTLQPIVFTLGTKCICELLGTLIGIYLGCSVIANALLPGAKGQSMGFGWIAMGYGLAFMVPGVMFGHISASLNPALTMADLVIGNINFQEFLAISAAQMVGAFLGAVCTWLHWLPHFKTVPEPPAANNSDNLLRNRDALTKTGIEIVSYNPHNPWLSGLQKKLSGKKRRKTTGGTSGGLGPAASSSDHAFTAGGVVVGGIPGQPAGSETSSEDSSAPGQVFAGLKRAARLVATNVMYYTVHHDDFAPQEDWKEDRLLPMIEEGSDALGSGGGGGGGGIDRRGTFVVRPSFKMGDAKNSDQGEVHVSLDDPELGGRRSVDIGRRSSQPIGTWENDGGSNASGGATQTRQQMNRTFQQETLDQMVAPQMQLYYAAAAAASTAPLHETRSGSEVSNIPIAPAARTMQPTVSMKFSARGDEQLAPVPESDPSFKSTKEEEDVSPPGTDEPQELSSGDEASPLPPPRPQKLPGAYSIMRKAPTTGRGAMAALAEGPEDLDPNATPQENAAAAALEMQRQRVMALYDAAMVADQNAKLSVFTTRPAIYSPPFNFLTEFMATVMLILGLKLMAARTQRLDFAGEALMPLYAGLYIVCQVLGLGGPTGFSVNPARDLGPRIAHFLLPIPNKGPSEWYYGWIPVVAPLIGAVAAAGLFLAIDHRVWPMPYIAQYPNVTYLG